MDEALDRGAIRLGIVDAAMVSLPGVTLAEVGEVKAACLVEHQIVGRREFVAVARGVELGHLAAGTVEALHEAVLVVRMRRHAHRVALDVAAAAVVAEIERTVGSDRETVGAAAGR